WDAASSPIAADLASAVGPLSGAIAADLDGDGLDDILLRDRSGGRAALLLGGIDGLRWARIAVPATSDPPPGPETAARIFTADVDGDGADEITAIGPAASLSTAPALRIALWKIEAGRLAPRVIIDAPLPSVPADDRVDGVIGRFRSDADGEEIIVRAERTLLLLGERRGMFEVGARAVGRIPAASGSGAREYTLEGADRMIAITRGIADGRHGRSDLLVQDAQLQRIAQVRVGTDGFEVVSEIGPDGPQPPSWVEGRMLAADVDGDGDEDLLLRQGDLDALYRARGGKFLLAWIALFDGDSLGWKLLAPFRRGDANGDGRLDIGDAVETLHHLFDRRATMPCDDAMDVDDSGDLTIADPIALLNYVFLNGRRPPAPGPDRAGFDPTDDALGCAAQILDSATLEASIAP
ncbi:MAG: hypothetical protein JXP34_20155, partial [Planctomycetes bacterium]|nr:hypothetical protein [Planctomycetota bacterium]